MIKTTEEYHLIDCDPHNYLEIACMYHYWLRVELTGGTCFDVKALTTRTTVEKEESLVVGQSKNQ